MSATQYVTYRLCADQARYRALGMYGADSRQSLRGSLAHRVFFRHLTATGERLGPDEVVTACLEEIGERFNSRLPGLGLAKMSALRPLLDEVNDLYERFAQVPMTGLRQAEIDLVHEPGGAVTLRGTVDAVFEDEAGIRLVDWKTGALGDAPHQLDFYALLWTLEHGEMPASVEAASVATGDRYVERPTRAALEDVASGVADLVACLREAFRTGEALPRSGGPHCRWCPAVNECPEGASVIRIGA